MQRCQDEVSERSVFRGRVLQMQLALLTFLLSSPFSSSASSPSLYFISFYFLFILLSRTLFFFDLFFLFFYYDSCFSFKSSFIPLPTHYFFFLSFFFYSLCYILFSFQSLFILPLFFIFLTPPFKTPSYNFFSFFFCPKKQHPFIKILFREST